MEKNTAVEESVVRDRIREMLRTGSLPCDEPTSTWGGNGSGHHCVVCRERIDETEVEYEVDLPSAKSLRLHRRCHALWLEECQQEVQSP
jgi:hypothetical protein